MIDHFYLSCDLNIFCNYYIVFYLLGCKNIPLNGGSHFVEAWGHLGPPLKSGPAYYLY